MNQKVSTAMGLIIVIAAAIIVASILAWQQGWFTKLAIAPTYTPTITSTPDVTANWKTYRNEQYGFEIKYPENWTAVESKSLKFPSLLFINIGDKETIQQGGFFSVSITNQSEVEHFSFAEQEGFYILNQSEVVLDNKKATIYVLRRVDVPDAQWKDVIMQKEGVLFNFSKGATPYYEDIFNQMLSTFKFDATTSNETAWWRISRNEEYGFAVKQPPDLSLNYIQEEEWPPEITVGEIDPNFTCEDSQNIKATEGYGVQKEVIFNNSKYCVSIAEDSAMSKNYVTYRYAIDKYGKRLVFRFVLKFTNCGVYDFDKSQECQKEKDNLNLTKMIDQMLSTFKFIE